MEKRRQDLGRRVVEARRRRDGVGFDHLRSGDQPRPVRHRQCRAVEPGGEQRLGGAAADDNLYTSSIVAVTPIPANMRGISRKTPEDRWDFDCNAQITIADLTIDGKQRHVALHAPKNGYFYVLDAKTGQFISGTAQTVINWSSGLDPKTGMTDQSQAQIRSDRQGLRRPARRGRFHSWQPMSYSPQTGYCISRPTSPVSLRGGEGPAGIDIGFQTAQDGAAVAMPADKVARAAAMAGTQGELLAWDVANKKPAWRVPYVGPWNGGVLSTAGGLVFQGSATENFSAFAASSGRQLWSCPDPDRGDRRADDLFHRRRAICRRARWLGGCGTSRRACCRRNRARRATSRGCWCSSSAPVQSSAGAAAQQADARPAGLHWHRRAGHAGCGPCSQRYCSVCHGDAAVAGALNPDLRRSASIGDVKRGPRDRDRREIAASGKWYLSRSRSSRLRQRRSANMRSSAPLRTKAPEGN